MKKSTLKKIFLLSTCMMVTAFPVVTHASIITESSNTVEVNTIEPRVLRIYVIEHPDVNRYFSASQVPQELWIRMEQDGHSYRGWLDLARIACDSRGYYGFYSGYLSEDM